MKKLIFVIFIIVGLFTGVTLSRAFSSEEKTVTPVVESAEVTPEEQISPTTVISEPITFSIPKIQVNTHVESVGLDADKNMDVPKEAANVGWYNLGVKPGEKGNAVLAGHFDDPNGDPAVFYELDSLEEGDTVEVTDENNVTYVFTVTHKESYAVDEFPISTVFGASDKEMLNLITCEGTFDKSAATYSHRLVVFTELSEVRKV